MRRAAAIPILLACVAVASAQPASAPSALTGPPTPVTVAIDLSALSPETATRLDALGLEARVILRLLQEGFAVVAAFAAPDVQVRAEEVNGAIRLIATGGGAEETVAVALGTGTRAELQLEIAQKVVDLSRSRVAAVQVARAKAREPPPPTPLRPLPRGPELPSAPEPRAIAVTASLGTAALWRGPGVDPQAQLSVGVEGRDLFGLGATFGADASAAPGLTVTEWQLTGGPRVHLLRAGRWSGDAALEVGVVSHAFRFEGLDVQEPEGVRLDVLAVLPVSLHYAFTDWLSAGVRLAPGIAGRAREHLRDGRVVWRREAARLEAGAQVGFAF